MGELGNIYVTIGADPSKLPSDFAAAKKPVDSFAQEVSKTLTFTPQVSFERLIEEVRRVTSTIQELPKAWQEAETAAKKTEKTTTESTQKIASSLQSTLRTIRSFALQFTVAISAPLIAFEKLSYDAAYAFEETTARFKVSFGEYAQSSKGWLDLYAESINRSGDQMLQFMATSQMLATSMGFNREKAADMSKVLIQLAMDLGRFRGRDPEEMLYALNMAMMGLTRTIRRMGILVNEPLMQLKMMELETTGLTGEALEFAKVEARLAIIQEAAGDAIGYAATRSEFAAAKVQKFKDNVMDLRRAFGKDFVQDFMPTLNSINTLLEYLVKMGPVGKTAAESLVYFGSAIGPIVSTGTHIGLSLVLLKLAGVSAATLGWGALIVAGILAIGAAALGTKRAYDEWAESVKSLHGVLLKTPTVEPLMSLEDLQERLSSSKEKYAIYKKELIPIIQRLESKGLVSGILNADKLDFSMKTTQDFLTAMERVIAAYKKEAEESGDVFSGNIEAFDVYRREFEVLVAIMSLEIDAINKKEINIKATLSKEALDLLLEFRWNWKALGEDIKVTSDAVDKFIDENMLDEDARKLEEITQLIEGATEAAEIAFTLHAAGVSEQWEIYESNLIRIMRLEGIREKMKMEGIEKARRGEKALFDYVASLRIDTEDPQLKKMQQKRKEFKEEMEKVIPGITIAGEYERQARLELSKKELDIDIQKREEELKADKEKKNTLKWNELRNKEEKTYFTQLQEEISIIDKIADAEDKRLETLKSETNEIFRQGKLGEDVAASQTATLKSEYLKQMGLTEQKFPRVEMPHKFESLGYEQAYRFGGLGEKKSIVQDITEALARSQAKQTAYEEWKRSIDEESLLLKDIRTNTANMGMYIEES